MDKIRPHKFFDVMKKYDEDRNIIAVVDENADSVREPLAKPRPHLPDPDMRFVVEYPNNLTPSPPAPDAVKSPGKKL